MILRATKPPGNAGGATRLRDAQLYLEVRQLMVPELVKEKRGKKYKTPRQLLLKIAKDTNQPLSTVEKQFMRGKGIVDAVF